MYFARTRLSAPIAGVLALAVAVALATTLLSPAQAARPGPAPAAKRFTDYGLVATGFGSRVTGGQVPTGSDETAFMVIACTTKVGTDKENHEANADLGGEGTISGVRTRLWTRRHHGVVSTYSRNTVGDVVLADSSLGRIEIKAISSFSRAYHDDDGFHTTTRTNVGSLVFVPPVGDPQQLDLPTPDQPVTIPGLATIRVGHRTEKSNSGRAIARADALIINNLATGSRVRVAHSNAQVLSGAKHGTFHGFSAGTRINAGQGSLDVGRTPLSLMPCGGTHGNVRSRQLAQSNPGDQAVVTGLESKEWAKARPGKSVAWERGSVAGINLGGGSLVVNGIVGKAKVIRRHGKVVRILKGTRIGSITANGEEQQLPDTGALEIPGVAKLRPKVVEKYANGVSVVALRITLLDGSGAVIDLGVAQMKIRRH